jgi:hypothetical protein
VIAALKKYILMKRFLVTTLFAVFAVPIAVGANGVEDGYMHWGGMMGGGGFGFGIFTLLYLVWLIVGIFAAIWLWQQITKK